MQLCENKKKLRNFEGIIVAYVEYSYCSLLYLQYFNLQIKIK